MWFKSKNNLRLIITIALLFIFVGCNSNTQEYIYTDTAINDSMYIVDRQGNSIFLPSKTDRIISMAPSITEVLVSLGLEENIIAVDTNSIGIKGLHDDIYTFDGMHVDIETLVYLNPDIIFVSEINVVEGESTFRPLTERGVFVTLIPTSRSIDDIKEDIRFIGEVTLRNEQAKDIINGMDREIYEIKATISGLELEKLVYFEISPSPHIFSFGKGVFLNEMLEILAVENIFINQEGWIPVSEEAVIMKNPDIIFTNVDYIDQPIAEIKSRNSWNVITAVQNDNVFLINSNYSSRPNHNIIIALREMAEALYPELFNSHE